jgi:hypothetical protein
MLPTFTDLSPVELTHFAHASGGILSHSLRPNIPTFCDTALGSCANAR